MGKTYGEVLYSQIQAGVDIGKQLIHPDGETGFALDGNDAVEYIVAVMKYNYVGPYNSWKGVPEPVWQLWFNEFQKYYVWTIEDHRQIYKNFKDRARNRLKDLICYVRNKGKRPTWITEHIWNDLCADWNKIEFRQRSERAKQNRASNSTDGPSLHTGGNIPFTDHAATLAEDFGRPITPVELHVRTHQNPTSGLWVDKKSEKIFNEYARLKTNIANAASAQNFSLANEVTLWTIAARGKKTDGSVYGLGSVSHKVEEDPPFGYHYRQENEYLSLSYPSVVGAIYPQGPQGRLHPDIEHKLEEFKVQMQANERVIFDIQRQIHEHWQQHKTSRVQHSSQRKEKNQTSNC